MRHIHAGAPLAFIALGLSALSAAYAQEESINPGINERFQNPDVEKFIQRFEREGREVYDRQEEVISALGLKPGDDVADIGAGTGFFTLLMAEKVGPKGTVYSLDIAENFVEHIRKTAAELGLKNVKAKINPPRSVGLKKNSIDAAFICDTYHHFEYPFDMLESIRKALRPGGVLVLIDFERVENVSKEFVLNMVRAGKGTFTDEFKDAGFDLVEEVRFSKEHYILKFTERANQPRRVDPKDKPRSRAGH